MVLILEESYLIESVLRYLCMYDWQVLGDTRSVQKEINQLSGVLDRTFAVTDELIFRDAKRDENVRKSYKFLAALHEVSTEMNHTW